MTHRRPFVVVEGLRTGVVTIEEAEAWFLHRIRAGAISETLGLLASGKRGDLKDVATVAVLDLMERGKLLEAGQVMAAEELTRDRTSAGVGSGGAGRRRAFLPPVPCGREWWP